MVSTILIVDDEYVGRATIEAILEGQDYRIETATNGLEALEKAEQLAPDLILLDIMMPGMNGFEVCTRLRSNAQLAEVPVLILTALDDRNSLLRGLEAGADDFLSKPVDRQELNARVRTILRLNRYRTLLNQRESLREMAGRVIAAQEKERQRISHDLHDDLGQSLTAHILNLRNLQNDLPIETEPLAQRLHQLTLETNDILAKMRSLAQNLRPPTLDALGLRSALETYCQDFSRRSHLPLEFDVDQSLPTLPDVHSITLYRFMQEALTNVVKHANATRVWVELTLDEQMITLTVQDNGQGFSEQGTKMNGIGIAGLRERLTMVGGALFISAAPGRGTIISARLPLEQPIYTGKELSS